MPNQVDGALVHAMSGNELSRVRTEFRLRPPEPINHCLLESRGPTLLCNHVEMKAVLVQRVLLAGRRPRMSLAFDGAEMEILATPSVYRF
jgi:hypothetical protein